MSAEKIGIPASARLQILYPSYTFAPFSRGCFSLFFAITLVNFVLSSHNTMMGFLSRHGWLKMNFYRLHIVYFLLTIILLSIVMYGSGVNGNSGDAEASFKLRYIDAIFLCASAMTNAGLNTINLNDLTGFQQSILYILILIGNVTVTTNAAIWIRRYFLRKHIKEFLDRSKAARERVEELDTEKGRIGSLANGAISTVSSGIRRLPRASGLQKDQTGISHYRQRHYEIGHGGLPYPWEWEISRKIGSRFTTPASLIQERLHHYLSFQPSFDKKVRPSTSKYQLRPTMT